MLDARYLEACERLDKTGKGSVKVKGGAVVTGSLLDWCSVTDDPEGRGYITLMTSNGDAVDVYSDEFLELTDDGSGGTPDEVVS